MLLVVVMVVTVLLSLAAYTFTDLMLSEYSAVEINGRRLQAKALTDSGLAIVTQLLSLSAEEETNAGGHYNNPQWFQGQLVVADNDARQRARVTIMAPKVDQEGHLAGTRYGLEDESARINLNALMKFGESDDSESLARGLLMGLPGMTEEIADAILDWMDPDSDQREFGAEVEYYSTLQPPYSPKNGPLESIEELLLVRGVTPGLLFGLDVNRNGVVDPSEQANEGAMGIDNTNGDMGRGWSAYLTLYSAESNLNPDGEPKIDLNNDDLEELYNQLSAVFPAEWATFIIAFRQNGASTGDLPDNIVKGSLDFDIEAQGSLGSILDLVGVNTQVQYVGQQQAVVLETPFPNDPIAMSVYLPTLWDHVTKETAEVIPGRINVNQASRTVLLGVPGMDEEKADRIIAARHPELTAENVGHRYETWLLAESIVTLDEMKQMVAFVCGQGHVYRANCGLLRPGRPGRTC